MTEGVTQALLTDLMLAAVLLALFLYVARLSRGVRGVAAWGAMHFTYTLGTTLLDAVSVSLEHGGRVAAAGVVMHLGVAFACAGIAGLAGAVTAFVHQRSLRWWERAFVPLAAAASLAVWPFDASRHAQTVVLSVVELMALVAMARHLFALREPPERLPARLMIACCLVLVLLYGSAVPRWPTGRFGLPDTWVSADVSIWFILNFCMLMLASFRTSASLRASAMADPLTGALNRRGLESALALRADALPVGAPQVAAIAMDIDHFKAINDRHGHSAGDQALQSRGASCAATTCSCAWAATSSWCCCAAPTPRPPPTSPSASARPSPRAPCIAPRKRGPAPKLQQQLEQLSRLPKAQQRLVSQLIDTVLQQHGN